MSSWRKFSGKILRRDDTWKETVFSVGHRSEQLRVSTGIWGMPAWPSLRECLRSAGDLPATLAWVAGPGGQGLGEGGRLRMLDRPRPLQAREARESCPDGDRGLVLSWEKPNPVWPPLTQGDHITYHPNLNTSENQMRSSQSCTVLVQTLYKQCLSIMFPGEIGYLVPLPWHELDFYINDVHLL